MSSLRMRRTTFIGSMMTALWLLAAGSAVAATKHAALQVAYSSISGTTIVPWIAVDKGLFAKYDLDVELIYVAGSQAMQSLLGGTPPICKMGTSLSGLKPHFSRVSLNSMSVDEP